MSLCDTLLCDLIKVCKYLELDVKYFLYMNPNSRSWYNKDEIFIFVWRYCYDIYLIIDMKMINDALYWVKLVKECWKKRMPGKLRSSCTFLGRRMFWQGLGPHCLDLYRFSWKDDEKKKLLFWSPGRLLREVPSWNPMSP